MFDIVEGNMFELETKRPVMLVHQVNCKGVMGSGVALQVRKLYPKVYEIFERKYSKAWYKPGLLGTCDFVNVNDDTVVCNLYGQDSYGVKFIDGKQVQHTDYEAFISGMRLVNAYVKKHGVKSVIFPFNIGCDRGGGKWSVIKEIIEDNLKDCDLEEVIYAKI